MKTEPFQEMGACGKLRVFSLYADLAASQRAKVVAAAIGRLARPQWQLTSEMWKLETLNAFEPVRRIIGGDAIRAEVLMVAVSSLEHPPQEMVRWLDSLAGFPSAHAAPRLLMGLLGDEAGRARELDWTVKQLIRCAQRLNRDFIWNWMEPEALNDLGWLNGTVQKLLSRKLSLREPLISQETVLGVG